MLQLLLRRLNRYDIETSEQLEKILSLSVGHVKRKCVFESLRPPGNIQTSLLSYRD